MDEIVVVRDTIQIMGVPSFNTVVLLSLVLAHTLILLQCLGHCQGHSPARPHAGPEDIDTKPARSPASSKPWTNTNPNSSILQSNTINNDMQESLNIPFHEVPDLGNAPSQVVTDLGHTPFHPVPNLGHASSHNIPDVGHASSHKTPDLGHASSHKTPYLGHAPSRNELRLEENSKTQDKNLKDVGEAGNDWLVENKTTVGTVDGVFTQCGEESLRTLLNMCEDLSSSCANQCGSVASKRASRYGSDVLEQTCSCDVMCALFQDCCSDYREFCPEQISTFTSQFGHMNGTRTSCTDSGYGVIAGCPSTRGVQDTTDVRPGNATPTSSFVYTDNETGLQYQDLATLQCHGISEARAVMWSKKYTYKMFDPATFANDFIDRIPYLEDVPPQTGHTPRLCPFFTLDCWSPAPTCVGIRSNKDKISRTCQRLQTHFKTHPDKSTSPSDPMCILKSIAVQSKMTYSSLVVLDKKNTFTFYNYNDRLSGWESLTCSNTEKGEHPNCYGIVCKKGLVSTGSSGCDVPSSITVSFSTINFDVKDFSSFTFSLASIMDSLEDLPLLQGQMSMKPGLMCTILYRIPHDRDVLVVPLPTLAQAIREGLTVDPRDLATPRWAEVCYTELEDTKAGWTVCERVDLTSPDMPLTGRSNDALSLTKFGIPLVVQTLLFVNK